MLQIIADYLRRNGGSDILVAYELNNELPKGKRNKFTNMLVDLMVKEHGLFPSRETKIGFSHAAISLFPCYKVSNSTNGGIVSIK